MKIHEIALLYLPPLLYLVIWIVINKPRFKIEILISILFLFLCCLTIYGYQEADKFSEITTIGNSILYSCSMWLIGPSLIFLSTQGTEQNKRNLIGIILTFILPPISFILCFFLLALMNQIG